MSVAGGYSGTAHSVAEELAEVRGAGEAEAYRDRRRWLVAVREETSHRRTPEAWDQLTPQEMQIARLAANGLSNREIGQPVPRSAGPRPRAPVSPCATRLAAGPWA